jgi:hypothetical protein
MKGSMFDVIAIIMVLFALPVIIILSDTVLETISDNVHGTNNLTVTTKDGITTEFPIVNTTHLEKGQKAIIGYDALMPFILIGLIAISVVLAFLIPTHPVMFVPSMFALMLMVIISAQLTNAYGIIANQPALQESANKMVITASLVNNYPLIATVVGAIIMIAMFISFKRPQEAAG